jgi:hypothetical protein
VAGSGSVLVIQSHRDPLPAAWYACCTESVVRWVDRQAFSYRWLGDEIFDLLDTGLREKLSSQPVVASDLARLRALELGLLEGHERVVWVDADVLVLDPAELRLPEAGALFGREVWVQRSADRRLKVHRKVHNAFMAFTANDPVLPFYRHAAERILRRYDGPMVPQLVGPKLLTLLHNAIGFDVLEEAAMLSPAVTKDLLAGGGEALGRFREACSASPLAINLCGSAISSGELTDRQMALLVDQIDVDRKLLTPTG